MIVIGAGSVVNRSIPSNTVAGMVLKSFKDLCAFWKADYSRYREYGAKPLAILLVKPGFTRTGTPVIGDDVYLGAGAKVIGGIHVGSNVAIGANCVVTKSMPDNAVVVGVPGRVISMSGNRAGKVQM